MGEFANNSRAIRRAFLDFFASRGHEEVASSSLVPENDPTLLFANAGMNQFKDAFTGKATRHRSRATTAQKCVRAGGKHNDLDNVGRTARHHTFFEMLGNFSFGDYFKEGAITFAHELLTDVFALPIARMVFTIHESDDDAAALWKKISGVPDRQIIRLGDKDNFWAMGETGPCGPCTEIHFHQGDDVPCSEEFAGRKCQGPACDCDRWIEIWNLVFMQFEQREDKSRIALPKPSVDTGMGLERLAAVLGGKRSNYETDLLSPIIAAAAVRAKKTFVPSDYSDGSVSVSLRAIADHARATAFLIADGVFPEKTGREYVLRRIMRRAVYHGHLLGITEPFFAGLVGQVVEAMKDAYSELGERHRTIIEVADQEERRFRETLDRGVRLLEDATHGLQGKLIPGDVAFKLYDTYGFPMDLTRVVAQNKGFDVDEAGFETRMSEQRKRADFGGSGEARIDTAFQVVLDRVGPTNFVGYEKTRAHGRVTALLVKVGDALSEAESAPTGADVYVVCDQTPFYGESGGQVGDTGKGKGPAGKLEIVDTLRPVPGLFAHLSRVSGGAIAVGDTVDLQVDVERRNAIARNHSATHLMHLALRQTLGEHVAQKGSQVSADRLRFDFSHFQPITPEELAKVEDMVTTRILNNATGVTQNLPVAEAKKSGAVAFFGEKYGATVRVLTLDDSKELCGGTHVVRTGDIGFFKITGETGVAQGVRRIEAVTGMGAAAWVRDMEQVLAGVAGRLRVAPAEVASRVERLQVELRERDREVEKLRAKLASGGGRDLISQAERVGGINVLVADVGVSDAKVLRETADRLRDKLDPGVAVLVGVEEDKLSLTCLVTPGALTRLHAGKLLGDMARTIGGKGGGRPDLAQGGGSKPDDLASVLDAWRARIKTLLGEAGAAAD